MHETDKDEWCLHWGSVKSLSIHAFRIDPDCRSRSVPECQKIWFRWLLQNECHSSDFSHFSTPAYSCVRKGALRSKKANEEWPSSTLCSRALDAVSRLQLRPAFKGQGQVKEFGHDIDVVCICKLLWYEFPLVKYLRRGAFVFTNSSFLSHFLLGVCGFHLHVTVQTFACCRSLDDILCRIL